MRSAQQIRELARTERRNFGGLSKNADPFIRQKLEDKGIELVGVSRSFLDGGRAELCPDEGLLNYDKRLDDDPPAMLELLAHEYGHLLMHDELLSGNRVVPGQLLYRASFSNSGIQGLTRYSPRAEAELEASLFAIELLCPAKNVFSLWREERYPLDKLIEHFCCTAHMVEIQLASGLFLTVHQSETKPAGVQTEPTTEQRDAARLLERPVLVDAGPGTGKTRTLVERVAFLIEERNEPPESILVLTFSNEAATELNERIERRVGPLAGNKVSALTFHGLGVRLLHILGHHIGLSEKYSLLDETYQLEIFLDLLGLVECEALLDITDPSKTASEVAHWVTYLKDRMVTPQTLESHLVEWAGSGPQKREKAYALLKLYEIYEKENRAHNRVDFADLISLPTQILAKHPQAQESLRKEYRWVLVDEYQDVSRATARFLQQICGQDNPPWVVGDARQAIYRFRGAAPENVWKFKDDFPNAEVLRLSKNFRSTPRIIEAANLLAGWLEADLPTMEEPQERWKAGREVPAVEPVITLAQANCDAAEHEGIVAAVSDWLSEGISPDEIAILARRNIDVRKLAISLKENGIRAATTGLLTAEGAGGDLSAVLAMVDEPAAAARVAYSLWKSEVPPPHLNSAISQVLDSVRAKIENPRFDGCKETQLVCRDLWKLIARFFEGTHTLDGWSILVDFLFFGSEYLHNLLARVDEADSAVQIDEVLSALSLAADYRFTHPGLQPRLSRIGLAARLRELVTNASSGLVPPSPDPGAVRVMTCHASKGLEFSCVAVAGQVLRKPDAETELLPPVLRPSNYSDSQQADSLLFVAATRAKRALVVSYAWSAGGANRRTREPTRLLNKWVSGRGRLPLREWELPRQASAAVRTGRLWGGDPPEKLTAFSLAKDSCQIRTYLETQLGVDLKTRIRPLYPLFIHRVRRMLTRVIKRSIKRGATLSRTQVLRIVEEEWPSDQFAKHPHTKLYRSLAFRWSEAFVANFQASYGEDLKVEALEFVASNGTRQNLSLQLIGVFRDHQGRIFSMSLRTKPSDKVDRVNWSEMKSYERLPFVVLEELHGNIERWLFIGQECRLKEVLPSQRSHHTGVTKEISRMRDAMTNLVDGTFEAEVKDWTCDRCRMRVVCPFWIGALEDPHKTP